MRKRETGEMTIAACMGESDSTCCLASAVSVFNLEDTNLSRQSVSDSTRVSKFG